LETNALMTHPKGEIAGTRAAGESEEPSQRFILAAYATADAARKALLSLPSSLGGGASCFSLADGSPNEAADGKSGARPHLRSLLQDCDSDGAATPGVEGLYFWALSTLGDGRHRGEASAPTMSERISEHLAHLLEDGGAVLILRVDGAEIQRSAARTLLDSKCEFLLTHEATVRHS
jgi:hypothetical protein